MLELQVRCLKVLTGGRLLGLGKCNCVGCAEKETVCRNAATKAVVVSIVSTREPTNTAALDAKPHFM